ncbi:hypothetical protein CEUSTIGMA_g9613.t1 [Chlamydomonas eustigma]|uniref:Mitochondrial import inner membrane translocase subunit TIM22 n=1 Tax=Chlamydomonas eustigma TaxID=1157962 RepID=A0A250XGH8_9CHLO|nr:hypothetical protein CEUSTIGMA_g9613.t1 [Chlamydomonas eustigma]|eukprot:GAX82185.1 hypothetical protein CEUSTIGMA_g9613.t1 [Chlamydomonas eustigma]
MVFSAVGYTNATTGALPHAPKEHVHVPIVDHQGYPAFMELLSDKSNPSLYALRNAPLISLAGVISGFQEAYYRFEKMPPSVSRQTFQQAVTLIGIVGRRTIYAAGIGALFCFTDATVEQMRGKHDMTSGLVAGAVAGLAYGGFRPMPQPVFWPLTFALAAASADLITEAIPKGMAGFRSYGPVEGRENWEDPAPPRPPIMDTSAAVRPLHGGHFWRGN